MTYQPKPIDTSGATLPKALDALTEFLAENTHEIWAKQRISDGWTYGERRDDARKEHPGLVPYEQLSESEKAYDRLTAMEALKTIQTLGYQILLPAAGSDATPATEATTLMVQLKSPAYIDFPTLHGIWQRHSQDPWRHLPEIYRLLGERVLKIGDLALAREIRFSVPATFSARAFSPTPSGRSRPPRFREKSQNRRRRQIRWTSGTT